MSVRTITIRVNDDEYDSIFSNWKRVCEELRVDISKNKYLKRILLEKI